MFRGSGTSSDSGNYLVCLLSSLKTITTIFGAPGGSVDRASDSGSRSPGIDTRAGHLVVDST